MPSRGDDNNVMAENLQQQPERERESGRLLLGVHFNIIWLCVLWEEWRAHSIRIITEMLF